MFKKVIFTLGLTALALTVLMGCSAALASANRVSLGREFTLPVGQSAQVSNEDLIIKFETVTTDSRSPIGAETIWAGEAKIQLQITYKGSTSAVVLTEKGLTNGYTETTFEQYTLSYKLLPYPEVEKQPAAGEYKLVMTVTK